MYKDFMGDSKNCRPHSSDVMTCFMFPKTNVTHQHFVGRYVAFLFYYGIYICNSI